MGECPVEVIHTVDTGWCVQTLQLTQLAGQEVGGKSVGRQQENHKTVKQPRVLRLAPQDNDLFWEVNRTSTEVERHGSTSGHKQIHNCWAK